MKDFIALERRLKIITSSLDGEFWWNMLMELDPPKVIPEEQKVLDMVYRDSKALSGYIPDLMALMQKIRPHGIDDAQKEALDGIKGLLNLAARYLVMLVIIPRYHDHEDLISALNGYRQTLQYVKEYQELANDNQTALA